MLYSKLPGKVWGAAVLTCLFSGLSAFASPVLETDGLIGCDRGMCLTVTEPTGYCPGEDMQLLVTVENQANYSFLEVRVIVSIPSDWTYVGTSAPFDPQPPLSGIPDPGSTVPLIFEFGESASATYTLPLVVRAPETGSELSFFAADCWYLRPNRSGLWGNTPRIPFYLRSCFAEGEIEGDGPAVLPYHSADSVDDYRIELSELLRLVQFYNSGGFSCPDADDQTEDGYQPGLGRIDCRPHASDYNPRDFRINLSELLRLVQFVNSGTYHPCTEDELPSEDGYCPGPAPAP